MNLVTRFPNLKVLQLTGNSEAKIENIQATNCWIDLEEISASHSEFIASLDFILLPNLTKFVYDNAEYKIKPENFCNFLKRHPILECLIISQINVSEFQNRTQINNLAFELRNLKILHFRMDVGFKGSEEFQRTFLNCIGKCCSNFKEIKIWFSNLKLKQYAEIRFQEGKNVTFYHVDCDDLQTK